ncbi:MAG: hypothetical protein VXZ71_08710, partial [SAR324 cluster bacterium]|nr:hypothetical protein [SAR324 cluster bacterium]
GPEQPAAGPKPNPDPEQPALSPESKLDPSSEPEPSSELGPEQPAAGPKPNPDPEQPQPAPEPILEPVVNPSEIDCELWSETQNAFKYLMLQFQLCMVKVNRTDTGKISVDRDLGCHDWSSDLPKYLLNLEDRLQEVQKFSRVQEELRGHPLVLSDDPKLYPTDGKMRVMAILEYWTSGGEEGEEVRRDLADDFKNVYKKVKTFKAIFDKREDGYDPNQELIGAYDFAKRLIAAGESDRGLAKLLDENSGAERDLFLWATVNKGSTYGDLVAKSQECFADDTHKVNAIMAPTPGLLLDELPCQGGIDESSD